MYKYLLLDPKNSLEVLSLIHANFPGTLAFLSPFRYSEIPGREI